jgi:putative tryptophan/tyrosine transport system substrate-binding protein
MRDFLRTTRLGQERAAFAAMHGPDCYTWTMILGLGVRPMRRREFIALLGSGVAGWPLVAGAQQPAMPVVGFLHQGSLRSYAHGADYLRRGLQETGSVEGRNVRFEFRWADGQYERLPELADDLIRLRPNVIVAALLPAARAVKAATATIPIVFISGSDPIEAGLVTSLNRPTENVTGVSLFSVPLISKRLELLHELVPAAATVGVLMNPSNPNAKSNEKRIESAARLMGLTVKFILASGDEDFEPAFATIVQQRDGAVIVSADGFFASRREQLVALAARHRIPTMFFQREFVSAGGLISYGAKSPDMYRQAGVYVGLILKGATPGDLPVMQPSKVELVINLKTAKSLGLTVPPTLIVRADEVIE